MLLSFSHDDMLPMVEAGLLPDREGVRTKRQTIRQRGPRGWPLLAMQPLSNTIPYDLHLWWKSRTPERRLIGIVPCDRVRIFPISILRSTVQPFDAPEYPILCIVGPEGWRDGDSCLFHRPGAYGPETAFAREAMLDGFESAEAFGDYFVPNSGGEFLGVLFKWTAPE